MNDNNDKPLFISSFNIKKSTPTEKRNQRNIIKTKKTTGSINGKSNLNDYSTKNDSLKKNVENIFPAKSELLDTNDTLNSSKLEYSEYKMVKKIARQIIKKNHSHNKKTKIAKNIFDGSANKNNHVNLNIVKQKCEKCFKIFKDQDGLQKHINFAHSEEKPYKCILCNSSFKNEFSLKAHKKIHFGENLYE
ncbi:zinc finger protein 891-like isoform X3 [Daktulosphaira vitifoliae]|nr:zinc finger protein 891-like isoform X2 [Daktulosphaira vitifoliae]XP_050537554.1 zinc finger protein 891-like isoform X3 [Daktulosphaira vitifoliae]